MKITVGIPVRNGAAYLREAIRSAVSQTRPADEILLIDDASTDGTAAIATSPEWRTRVRYLFNERPSGFADAFNRLAAVAQGDYLCILCADDILDPDCLEVLERGLTTFPNSRFSHAGFRNVSAEGHLLSTSPAPHTCDAHLVPGATYAHDLLIAIEDGNPLHRCIAFLVETKLMREQCHFRQEAGLIADTDFLIRIASLGSIVRITMPLASLRCHDHSVTTTLDSIPLALSRDYLFQVRHNKDVAPEIRGIHQSVCNTLLTRVLDHLFVEAIRRGRVDLLSHAISLQREFITSFKAVRKAPFRLSRHYIWEKAADSRLLKFMLIALARIHAFLGPSNPAASK